MVSLINVCGCCQPAKSSDVCLNTKDIRRTVKIIEKDNPHSEITYWGDVMDVINGTLRPEVWAKEIAASSFRYAFEFGAVRDERTTKPGEGIPPEQGGECVCAFGSAYSRSCDRKSPYYYTTHIGKSLRTMGLAIVGPRDARPHFEVYISGDTSYSRLIQDIFNYVGRKSMTYGGVVEWETMNVTACAEPTSQGENIFENNAKYYPKDLAGPHDRTKVHTVIHGFCAEMNHIKATDLFKPMSGVLYAKPDFMKTATEEPSKMELTMHAHLITTDPPDDKLLTDETYQFDERILPKDPYKAEVFHLNGGIIKRGRLEIYIIDEMKHHTKFIQK